MKKPEKLIVIARAVSSPTRLAILRSLGEAGSTVTTTAAAVNVALSTASFHLSQLVDAGLAVKTVKGREVTYKWSTSRWQLARMRPPAPPTPEETSP